MHLENQQAPKMHGNIFQHNLSISLEETEKESKEIEKSACQLSTYLSKIICALEQQISQQEPWKSPGVFSCTFSCSYDEVQVSQTRTKS